MELIRITNDNGVNLVSARELHVFLEVGRDFTTWIKQRIDKYGFEENVDFTVISVQSNKASHGGQNKVDYVINIDMAKALCSIEKTHKAGEALNILGQDVVHIHTYTRFEIAFGEMLTEALAEIGLTVEKQFNVDGYRVDFYIHNLNIAIEYDEKQHYTLENQKMDAQRQEYIEGKIGAKFIRCDYRDSDIKNVMKVLKEVM